MMFDVWWARTITSILFLNDFQGNLKCFINTDKDLEPVLEEDLNKQNLVFQIQMGRLLDNLVVVEVVQLLSRVSLLWPHGL